MKVKELIEALKNYNPEAEVLMDCGDDQIYHFPVDRIKELNEGNFILFEQY